MGDQLLFELNGRLYLNKKKKTKKNIPLSFGLPFQCLAKLDFFSTVSQISHSLDEGLLDNFNALADHSYFS